jgi:hypothetical protein
MKILKTLCLVVAVFLPLIAQADLPFSNEGFGTVEAILDYCQQANASQAQKYEERKTALVRNLPEEEVAEARSSEEYKQAYGATRDQVAEQPQDKVVEACTAYLKDDK